MSSGRDMLPPRFGQGRRRPAGGGMGARMGGAFGGMGNAALAEMMRSGQGPAVEEEKPAATVDAATTDTTEVQKAVPVTEAAVDSKAIDPKAADPKAVDTKTADPKAVAQPVVATDKPVTATDSDVKAIAEKAVLEPKPEAVAVADPKVAAAVEPTVAAAVEPKVAAAVEPKVAAAVEPVAAAVEAKKPDPEAALPAWATQPNVSKTLKAGATGEDVEKLQLKLGVTVTGTFDPTTKEAISAFQKNNGLTADGVAGPNTLSALGLWDPFRSKAHDPNKFVPTYRATAYSESDSYRTKDDPYAVGARSNPTRDDDDGGKTYGTYQFESYVYRDMSKKSDKAVTGSTLTRFVNWKENPFGEELRQVVAAGGLASKAFDAKWAELTKRDNKAFGKAQEEFLDVDKMDEVKGFMKRGKVSEVAQQDPDLVDVTMGTVNQYGDLAGGQADHVAAAGAKAKDPLTANQVGNELQDFKADNVKKNFRSSPNAWGGVKDRIKREKKLFKD